MFDFAWGDWAAGVGAVAFVAAVFRLLSLPRSERFSRRAVLWWIIVLLFLVAVLVSMIVETLSPVMRGGSTGRAVRSAAGLALVLFAVLLFTWSGYRTVAGVVRTSRGEEFLRNAEIVRAGASASSAEAVRAAHRANLRSVFRAAGPGCLGMLLGFALLAAGGRLAG